MACVNGVDTVTGRPCSLGVTKYGAAPPGARAGAKAAGIGAPGSTTYTPPSAPAPSVAEPIDIAAAVAEAVGGLDLSGGIDWGAYGGGGSGSGGAPKSYYDAIGAARTSEAETAGAKFALDAAKYEDQLALDAAALQRKGLGAQEALKYYEAQLGGVQGGQIPEALNTTLEEQKAARDLFANTTYGNLLSRLGTRYGEAQGLTDEGFGALKTYLEGAPQNAYATAPRATAAPVANDIAQYMQSQGVDAARVQPGLLAAQAAAQGGAASYNNLLTTLAATSTQANQSRLNEQAMAQRLAQATLTAQKASQEGVLDQAKIAQLNAIQEQYTASRLQLQKDSIARENALRDAIAQLGISGNLNIDTTESTETPEERAARIAAATAAEKAAADKAAAETAASRSGAVNTLAKQVANAKNTALTTRVDKFIAANPKATPAQVKEEFPKLRAAAVKATAAAKKKK